MRILSLLKSKFNERVMPEYVYLVRNGDLYSIGKSPQLQQVKQSLKPGEIVAALKTTDASEILKILQSTYYEKRLPQSNYFRLSKSQAIDCKKKLEKGRNKADFKPFFSGPKLLILFISTWVGLSLAIIKFAIEPVFNQFG